jgi:uncharacterized protein
LMWSTFVHTFSDGFQWDPVKASANLEEHRVDFGDATEVFFDPWALTIRDDHPTEERFVTVGKDAFDRVLVVVYCWRGEEIRLISARRATARERREYKGWQ